MTAILPIGTSAVKTPGAAASTSQQIVLMDKDKVARVVSLTSDKVDEYISEKKKNERKQWISIISGTVVGIALGLLAGVKNFKGFDKVDCGILGTCAGLGLGALSAGLLDTFGMRAINKKYIDMANNK